MTAPRTHRRRPRRAPEWRADRALRAVPPLPETGAATPPGPTQDGTGPLGPATTVDNVAVVVPFRGTLHLVTLRRALRTVLARHDRPRTDSRRGTEVVLEPLPPGLPVTERPVHGAVEGDEWPGAVATVLAPVDLTRGPVRFGGVHADDGHLLVGVIHHPAFDGWSLGVFVRDLGEHSRADLARRPLPRPRAVPEAVAS